MKIPLKMDTGRIMSEKEEKARILEHDIISCKNGDWEAKARLIRTFMPLLISLAKKRTQDNAAVNRYVEAGKNGLANAAAKYKTSVGADRFQIFALDFIEQEMNRAEPKKGFFARLFGKG